MASSSTQLPDARLVVTGHTPDGTSIFTFDDIRTGEVCRIAVVMVGTEKIVPLRAGKSWRRRCLGRSQSRG
jgi:hypothetical protein